MKKKAISKWLNFNNENFWEDLSKQIEAHNHLKGKSKSEIEENLAELSRVEREELWTALFDKFSHLVQNYMGYECSLNDSMQLTQNLQIIEKENYMMICSILKLALIQLDVLSEEKIETASPGCLVKLTLVVGNLLCSFPEGDVGALSLNLCENWLQKSRESHQSLVEPTFTALLQLCLNNKAIKKDVKRAYNARNGLESLSARLNSNKADQVKRLLLTCASRPLFLSVDEGIKILSSIFVIPSLMLPFHQTVKENLLQVTKAQSVKYAEVYFRAWKNSSHDVKKNIENQCLQDLMHLGVHVDPAEVRLAANLTSFLHYIHQHKKHLPTASLIYSLYEPFLWRSLKVANGFVRMNASAILCDLYPCTNESLTMEGKDDLMSRQYESITNLLTDECHWVRISTVKGVFSILSNYWLLVPTSVVQKWFNILLNKLVVDASSAEVRMLVIQGLTKLLDNPEAGSFITNILPHFSGAFDDINASVRIAFIKLLLKIKSTRFIKYWKLVPIEHLLNRLAQDVISVKKLICQLLSSSFLPAHLSDQDKLQRCIAMIEMNRNGTRSFFQNVGKKLDIEAATRFISFVWTAIMGYVQMSTNTETSSAKNTVSEEGVRETSKRASKKSRSLLGSQSSNKENEDESEDGSDMPLDDPEVVGGLLDVIVILWTMNAAQLAKQQNLKYLDHLKTRVSRGFPSVWSFFKDSFDISKTLIYLSSFLPKSQVPLMVSMCLARLKEMPDNTCEDDRFGTYVNALCNWNRVGDLVEVISESLDSGFDSVSDFRNKNRDSVDAKKGGRVCFGSVQHPKPKLGLKILDYILCHSLNRLNLLQTNRQLLQELGDQMANVKRCIDCRTVTGKKPLSKMCTDEFLIQCWSSYLVVVSLLQREPEGSQNGQSRTPANDGHDEAANASNTVPTEIFDWLDDLYCKKDQNPTFDETFLSVVCCKYLNSYADAIAIGYSDEDFTKKVLSFGIKLIAELPPYDVELYCSFLRLISQLHFHLTAFSPNNHHLNPTRSVTFEAFSSFLQSIRDYERYLSDFSLESVSKMSEVLSTCLSTLSRGSPEFLKSLMDQMSTTMATCSQSYDQAKFEVFIRLDSLNQLPHVMLIFVNSVWKHLPLLQSLVTSLIKQVANLKSERDSLVLSSIVIELLKSKKLSKFSRGVSVGELRSALDGIFSPETGQLEPSEDFRLISNKIDGIGRALENAD